MGESSKRLVWIENKVRSVQGLRDEAHRQCEHTHRFSVHNHRIDWTWRRPFASDLASTWVVAGIVGCYYSWDPRLPKIGRTSSSATGRQRYIEDVFAQSWCMLAINEECFTTQEPWSTCNKTRSVETAGETEDRLDVGLKISSDFSVRRVEGILQQK